MLKKKITFEKTKPNQPQFIMKKTFTLILLLAISIASAQTKYYKTKISLANGNETEGYAELPSNGSLDRAINYKKTEDAKSTRIKNDSILRITYLTDKNSFTFERLPIRTLNKSFGKYYDNIAKSKTWLLVQSYNPIINTYLVSTKYSIEANGTMNAKTTDYSGMGADIVTYIKRPGETGALQLGIMSSIKMMGLDSMFRKTASEYFKDAPELVKRIEAKEFGNDNLQELLNAYIILKENGTVQNNKPN